MDKAYINFERLHSIHSEKAFFVVRAKENLQFTRIKSKPANKVKNILCGQEIKLKGFYSGKNYPENLRRVKFYDTEFDRTFVFLTNNNKIGGHTVAKLYKSRWSVEIFFKWIKQHLKIKSFWGQNENAVRSQIWAAISSYVIVAIAKKQLNIPNSLYEILQYISIAPFEKTPMSETFTIEKWQKTKEREYPHLEIF